jgi:hypothetical protein
MSGALCISIDLELAWGMWDIPSAAYDHRCAEKERAVVGALLDLFASRSVPATWAIVGRLLDASDGAPDATWLWNHIWYAPDVVDAIRAAAPGHDLGSHSFAHVYFQELDRERLRSDLQAARRTHERHGLAFTSFVFPRNQVAHLDLLAEAGVKVFRGADVGWHATARRQLGRTPGRAAHLVDELLPFPPAVVEPISHPCGLVEVPGSMLLFGRDGVRCLARPEITILKAKLGLHRAAREGRVFHLWFQPANFYARTEAQLRLLERILDEACALRERGTLEIRTMASYATRA